MGLYAADGSIRLTVVAGSSVTGLYADDGSWNVVEATGLAPCGIYHPCGALNVTLNDSTLCGHYAPDGSMNVTSNGTKNGAQRVTVVSGSLGGSTAGQAIGLLLILTKAA